MATYTENYNLKMPSGQDAPDVEDFNGNAEIIDQTLKQHEDGISSLNSRMITGIVIGNEPLVLSGNSIIVITFEDEANYAIFGARSNVTYKLIGTGTAITMTANGDGTYTLANADMRIGARYVAFILG